MYDSDSEGAPPNITNQTYVKPIRTEKSLPRNTHPPYMQMIHESIEAISTHGKAVSRAKIVEQMKEKYSLNDVSNTIVSRALRVALEKNIIENTTATGAMGSFKLTKTFKEKQKSLAKTLVKKESKSKLKKLDEKQKKTKNTKDEVFEEDDNSEGAAAAPPKKSKSSLKKKTDKRKPINEDENGSEEFEEEVPSRPAATTKRSSAKTSKSSEGDENKKKTIKKPPTGKENKSKDTSSVGTTTSEKKILKEKIKSMKKAISAPVLKEVEENIEDDEVVVEKPKRGRKAK